MRRLLLLLLVILLTTRCGNDGGDRLFESTIPTTTTLTIGVIAPLQAGLTAFGLGIRNSAQLAVDQANRNQTLPGIRLVLESYDDSSDPQVGAQAARALAANNTVVGVIGTYNSGVAFQTAPILGAASIAQISPANTDPALTLGPDPANPVRPFVNYFRMVVPDTVQGPVLARFAFNNLGLRRVAVVTESKSVSQGLANNFSLELTNLGGTVLITEVVPALTTDYSAILARVAATNPELLFYGGEYQTAATVRLQARQAGIAAPLMGGDGIKDDAYIADTGAASEGDFASTVGAPLASLPGGARFLQDYQAAGFPDPPTDYGPFAYDATNTLIAALAATLSNTNSFDTTSRANILTQLQATRSSGVTGAVAFDAFGDPVNELLTIYQVQNGRWVPVP